MTIAAPDRRGRRSITIDVDGRPAELSGGALGEGAMRANVRDFSGEAQRWHVTVRLTSSWLARQLGACVELVDLLGAAGDTDSPAAPAAAGHRQVANQCPQI